MAEGEAAVREGWRDQPKQSVIAEYSAARDELDAVIARLTPATRCGGWTVADIAAHVAAWEERTASLIPALAEGETAPPPDVDAFNAAAADSVSRCGDAWAMASYRAARLPVVEALGTAPPAAFLRAAVLDQVAMEREHSRGHAAELRSLADVEVEAMQQTLHDLVERYRGARDTLAEAVAAHPDARTGSWRGREVLMHVSGWDRYAVEWVPRLAAGEREEPYDEDAVNAAFVDERQAMTDDELRADYAASGDAFVAMLSALPATALLDGAPGEDWATGLADHALEHAAVFGDIGS